MISDAHTNGENTLKSTVTETAGVAGIWTAYWQSHSANDVLQTVALVLGIVGSILYIAVMIKKLMAPRITLEGD